MTGATAPCQTKNLAAQTARIIALILVVVFCKGAVKCMVAVSAFSKAVCDVNDGNIMRRLHSGVNTHDEANFMNICIYRYILWCGRCAVTCYSISNATPITGDSLVMNVCVL